MSLIMCSMWKLQMQRRRRKKNQETRKNIWKSKVIDKALNCVDTPTQKIKRERERESDLLNKYHLIVFKSINQSIKIKLLNLPNQLSSIWLISKKKYSRRSTSKRNENWEREKYNWLSNQDLRQQIKKTIWRDEINQKSLLLFSPPHTFFPPEIIFYILKQTIIIC